MLVPINGGIYLGLCIDAIEHLEEDVEHNEAFAHDQYWPGEWDIIYEKLHQEQNQWE